MSHKCPTCNRVIRAKKRETPEEADKRITAKAQAGVGAMLRRPMPKATQYRE